MSDRGIDLLDDLEELYHERGIHSLDFHCASLAHCRGSESNFTEARASLVGSHYGDPIRVVVLSSDVPRGENPMDRTLSAIRERETQQRAAEVLATRPHYHWARTHATVAALLSHFGRKHEPLDAVGRFAHMNAARCSVNNQWGAQGPGRLFSRCRPHARAELKILSPDIVIAQGRTVEDNTVSPIMSHVRGEPANVRTIFGGSPFYLLQLCHPTDKRGSFNKERQHWATLFGEAANWCQERA